MRRPNGTGTVVRLKGNRRRPFAVMISVRDQYNRLKQIPLSYHTTSSEAFAALHEYSPDMGRITKPEQINWTVQEVYDAWSSREYAKLEQAGRTSSLQSHKAAWNKRVSRLSAQKMREVTLDSLQALLDDDEDSGLSQSSINNDAILIRALCSYAMKRDIISKDYSEYLETPSVDPKNPKGAFTDIQLAQLRKMAEAGVPWADTVLMLCYTGYRITEFLTLTPFSYDRKGNIIQAGIKSTAGKNRVVPVHAVIKPYLTSWLEKGGHTIICDNRGNAISSSKYRTELFAPIAAAMGVPEATPHWCRHTFQTRLHAAGVDGLTSKWLLGHSTKGDVTAGYTHATIDVLTSAILKLA